MQGNLAEPGLIPKTVEALMEHAWQIQEQDTGFRIELSMSYLVSQSSKPRRPHGLINQPGNLQRQGLRPAGSAGAGETWSRP